MKVSDNLTPGSVSSKPKNAINESLKKTACENWITLSIPIALFVAAIFGIWLDGTIIISFLLVIANIFSSVFIYFKIQSNQQKFIVKYRDDIARKLLLQLDNTIEYDPESYIGARNFNASGMFKMIPNIYKGENYIKVTEPDYVAELSYINATKGHTTINEDGSKSGSFDPVFEGVFYLFSLPVTISGITIIRTDKTHGILGFFNEEEERIYGKFNKVVLADKDFEVDFEVYSNNSAETLKLLEPSMRALLVKIKRDHPAALQISIIGQYVYASLYTKQRYFFPNFILSGRSKLLKKSEDDAKFLLESALWFKPVIGKIIMYDVFKK